MLSAVQVLGQYLPDPESECLLEFCALGAMLSSLYSWPCSLPSLDFFLPGSHAILCLALLPHFCGAHPP